MAVAAASGDLAVGEDDLAAGNREQAARGEFLRARHRSAELDDPAAGDTDISGFPVTGRDHRRTADTQVKTHHSILARGRLATPWRLPVPRPGAMRSASLIRLLGEASTTPKE